MNSRRKGYRGEAELVSYLTAEGFPSHRNNQMYVGAKDNPDVFCPRLEEFHFEIKRTERLNLGAAMAQAERDAAGRIPAVVSRKNRQPWLITMRLTDWLEEVKKNA